MSDKNLTLLVGPMGCGKTTYCEKHYRGFTRVSQDEQGKEGHMLAFRTAITNGVPNIVIDKCNAIRDQRVNFLTMAKRAGYNTKIVWFNEPREICIQRINARKNHPTLHSKDAEVALNTFFQKLQFPSDREADELQIFGTPNYVPVVDLREAIGERRHLIVGDLHGCLDELQDILGMQEFDEKEDVLVCVGDFVDRGPKIRETVEFLMSLPRFYGVKGNHDHKFLRWMQGKPVKVGAGLQSTIDSFGGKVPERVREFFTNLPLILRTPSGYCVHAGFDPWLGPEQQKHDDCLYMRYYGGENYLDEHRGKLWYKMWPWNAPRVFYGHIAENGPIRENLVSLDEGAVFGNRLRLFDSRDGGVYSVEARECYSGTKEGSV